MVRLSLSLFTSDTVACGNDHCHAACLTGIGRNGRIDGMITGIDSAGRIVVPKPLRDALGLAPGQALEIAAVDGRLQIAIAATPMTLKKRGRSVVAVPDVPVPPLTSEMVRDTLERARR